MTNLAICHVFDDRLFCLRIQTYDICGTGFDAFFTADAAVNTVYAHGYPLMGEF